MGPGSHMILMLLWARKEARPTKYMVRFMQMALNSALSAIPSALGCSGWRNHLRFIRFIRASILSLFYTLANPHHAGNGHMELDIPLNTNVGLRTGLVGWVFSLRVTLNIRCMHYPPPFHTAPTSP